MRAHLLCLAAREVLLLTLHHIVADGWSMEVLLRELAELYEGFVVGASVRLPDLPIQYPDYAVGNVGGCRRTRWSGSSPIGRCGLPVPLRFWSFLPTSPNREVVLPGGRRETRPVQEPRG